MKRTSEDREALDTGCVRKKANTTSTDVPPVLNLYKPVSKTPKEVIEQFKELNPAYKDIKVGYAGRLDPMARG